MKNVLIACPPLGKDVLFSHSSVGWGENAPVVRGQWKRREAFVQWMLTEPLAVG